MITVKFKKLSPDAVAPTRAKDGDAGWDLCLHSISPVDETPDAWYFLTGVAVEIPVGYFGLLRPRSSIIKSRYLMVSSGIIDSGYRGEIAMPVAFRSKLPIDPYKYITRWDRIGQLVILPLPEVQFEEVSELSESERGTGGFGSTGK